MVIRQIKAYKIVSILSLMAGIAALQKIYINETLLIAGFASGVLGTFLLGSAAIVTVIRFVREFVKVKGLTILHRFIGLALSISPIILWYVCNAKFVLIPAFNAEQLSDFFIPSALSAINGGVGIYLFFVVVDVNKKLLAKGIS